MKENSLPTALDRRKQRLKTAVAQGMQPVGQNGGSQKRAGYVPHEPANLDIFPEFTKD